MLRVNGRRYSVNGSNYFVHYLQVSGEAVTKYEVDVHFFAIYLV